MKSRIFWFAVAATVFLVPAASTLGVEAPRIQNSNEPELGTTTIELEPLWTIGGSDDEVLLGTIERVLTLEDGRVFMLDSQLSQVLECSPDGEVVRQLGHPGEGPGELTNPRDLVRFDDGKLGLVKVFPGQLVMLDPDGLPAGVIKLKADDAPGGFVTLHRALQTGGTLLLGGSVMTMNPDLPLQKRTFFLGRFDREGNKTVEYVRGEATFDVRKGKLLESWQEFVWSRMGLAADGTVVVCIPRDEFDLSWFSPEGTLLRSATLPFKPWPRNQLAHDRMHSILQRQADHMPGTEPVVAPTEPVVVDLMVRGNGDVWCLTSQSMWEAQDGVFASYEVIDEAGHYTQRVRVVCEGDATRDRLIISGDRAYRVAGYWDAVFRVQNSVAGENPEPMSVTCYRIRR
jgi:hypothetical protein